MRLMRSAFAAILLGLVVQAAASAPPDVPARVPVKTGKAKVLTFAVDPTKKITFAPGFDPDKCIFERLMVDDPATAKFLVVANEDGDFYVTFWTRGADEAGYKQAIIEATVSGKKPTDPPAKDPPPIVPPPAPAVYYFLIVRPDGPASQEFVRAIGLPEWSALKAAGHQFKDKTATDAAALGAKIPAGSTLPVVVVLQRIPGQDANRQVKVVPFPTTGPGVAGLPEQAK